MTDHRNISTDEGLKDNERMEQAILSLQQNPTQEMLAHALTVAGTCVDCCTQTDAGSRTADRGRGATGGKSADAPAGYSDR